MTDERAVKRFPNIEMCGKGCTSGSWNEWPVLRAECRAILAMLAEKDAEISGLIRDAAGMMEERDRLAKQVERLKWLLKRAAHSVATVRFNTGHNTGLEDEIDAALTEKPND